MSNKYSVQIRAWKDPEFRRDLSDEELSKLESHPAGEIEIEGTELDKARGNFIIGIASLIFGSCTILCAASKVHPKRCKEIEDIGKFTL
jgi:mersacidin/lichenicidin family type 2 lantibiotic